MSLREDVLTDDNIGECLIASNRLLSAYILEFQCFFTTFIGADSNGDVGISFSVGPQNGDCVAKIGPDNNNNNNNNIINNNTDDGNQSMKGNLVQIKVNPVSVEEKAADVDLDEADMENENRPLCAKPSTVTVVGRCKGIIFL